MSLQIEPMMLGDHITLALVLFAAAALLLVAVFTIGWATPHGVEQARKPTEKGR